MGWEGIFDYHTKDNIQAGFSSTPTQVKESGKKEVEKKELEDKIQKKSKEILEKCDVYF